MLTEFRNYLLSLQDASEITIEMNTIYFQYKDLYFLFVIDESDPYYIRLILPNIATTDKLKNGIEPDTVINDYNTKFKAAKMSVFENSIWLSIEQFIYSKERVAELFTRMIDILIAVITDFRRENLIQ